MRAKTILTLLGDEQSPDFLNPAIDFCRQTDSHLSVLIVGAAPPPPTVTYGGLSADLWVEATTAAREKIEKCRDATEAHLQAAALSSDVTTEVAPSGLIDDEIGNRARYADLTLVAAPEQAEDGITDHQIANGVLFHAAKPLLLLRNEKPTFPPKRIVLAWDASLEASKAAHEAIGLMQAAEDVRIVLIDPEPVKAGHGPEPGSNIATFLARHGITVTVDRVAGSGQNISDCLIQFAGDCDADLIVMGAYGHSRLRERIFGGTTEAMLKQASIPVLMMH